MLRLVVATILLLALLAGAAFACLSDRIPYHGLSVAPNMSFQPNTVGTLAEARRRFRFPIPELPAISLPDACGREVSRVSLVSVTGTKNAVVLGYTHGLWISVGTEPGGRLLGDWGTPRRKIDGMVRGHPAEITLRGWKRRYFFCSSGYDCDDFLRDSVRPGDWYPLGAELAWTERGANIHLQGPFPESEMVYLAGRLRFGPA